MGTDKPVETKIRRRNILFCFSLSEVFMSMGGLDREMMGEPPAVLVDRHYFPYYHVTSG